MRIATWPVADVLGLNAPAFGMALCFSLLVMASLVDSSRLPAHRSACSTFPPSLSCASPNLTLLSKILQGPDFQEICHTGSENSHLSSS
jgi:hypothetical protein